MSWWILVLACHVGAPPSTVPALAVGEVRVASVEGALGDDLRGALAASLAARGALGDAGGRERVPQVVVEVLEADTTVTGAAGGGAQVHMARLRVRFAVAGPYPREIVLDGERAYALETTGADAPEVAAGARTAAFSDLARELCDDAATWLLLAPSPGVAAP